MNRKKEDIVRDLNSIAAAMSKHRNLAMWGNVESKVRLIELRKRKKELQNELVLINR